MEIYGERQIIKNVIIGYDCNSCHERYYGDSLPNNWHHFSSLHHEWEGAGCTSYETYDACSVECYINLFNKCVEDMKDFESATIDNYTIQFSKKLLQKPINGVTL